MSVPKAAYKLRKTISGHENDVRAIAFVEDDTLVTTSRDGKAKLTSGAGESQDLVDSTQFLNACAVDKEHGFVFIGSHDSSIIRCDLNSLEQVYFIGHSGNVSCLDTESSTGRLASGSWDSTVRIWESPETSFELKGHSQYIWDVKFVNDTHVLSASADKLIKLWDLHSRKELKTFSGHLDVVRALLVISSDFFLSASNDGTVKKWNLATGKLVETWEGHSSFIYSLTSLNKDLVASSSEDRTVRIWDITSGQTVQTILLPSISQWCLASNELGEFAVGSSDNTARVFSPIQERQASAEQLADFAQSVRESGIGESEVDESQIASAEVLNHPGKQEGQVVIIRNKETSKLEAHQYAGAAWTKIGDVIGSGQASGSKKQSFNGKQYDYVFDVDIADDQNSLKLPFNNSDNPYITAEKFVAENNLPASYVDQVVRFLITNSEAKSFGTTGTPSSAAAAPSTNANTDGPSTNTIPSTVSAGGEVPKALQFSELLRIKSFQEGPLLKTLEKIAQRKGEKIEVYHLDSLLNSLPSSSSTLLQVAMELNGKWSQDIDDLLPVLDLLRIALADASAIPHQTVWIQLISALDANIPKHCMLAVRGIVNLLANISFDPNSPSSKAMLDQAIVMIQQVVRDTSSLSKPLATALSTLVLNLSVQRQVLDFVAFIRELAPKVIASGDAEACYRLLLATGLRSLTSDASQLSLSWFEGLPQEPRISDLLALLAQRIPS